MKSNSLFGKLIFLWVGNICKWIYYGGKKRMDDVAKEDNETLGLIVTVFCLLVYFAFR
jgi:hypothetical protein